MKSQEREKWIDKCNKKLFDGDIMDLKHFSKAELIGTIAKKEKQINELITENKLLKYNPQIFFDKENEFFSLRQIIALMPGTVFWKDKKGFYQGCNNNLAHFLGLASPDDIIGKNNYDLMSKELADPLEKIDREIMETGKGRHVEETGINLNNEYIFFYTQKIPLRNQRGEIIGLLGISIDITERKIIEKKLKIAKEQAEASDKAKSEFLAVVNHEVRNPLTGILGLLDILKKNNLTLEEVKKLIDDLENCAQYLLTLVENVLDLTKLEAKKKKIYFTPTNLVNVITEVTSMVAALAGKKGLDLKTQMDKSIPDLILIDELALHQILLNIINNAIKFTERGHILIEARCLQQIKNHARIEIAIHDTGKGIPGEQQSLIFNPFYQLEDIYLRSSSRNGTGLGLAIVKKLSALLNMDIRVESKVGEGSSFYLNGEYKIYKKRLLKQSLSQVNKINNYISPKKIKILLVEDDNIVQHIHAKILEDYGYHVDVANNGSLAIKMFDHHHIMLVDIGLPDINGFELIRLIRNDANINKKLPIIALTGYTGEKEKSACFEAGANEIINKPVSANHLKKLVERYT